MENKDVNIIISLKYYEELLENKSSHIKALQKVISVLKASHDTLTIGMDSLSIDYKKTREYQALIDILKTIIFQDRLFIGFNKDNILIINEDEK